MYRSRLALGLIAGLIAVAGCKKNEDAAKPKAEAPVVSKAAALDALDVPRDVVWAGSAHLRIVDVAAGQVVAGVDLQRSITDIAFTPDGLRGFVAASDGVREIDVTSHEVKAQLTKFPAPSACARST